MSIVSLVQTRLRWLLRSRLAQLASVTTFVFFAFSILNLYRRPSFYTPETHFFHLDFAKGETTHPIERLVIDTHAIHHGWLKRQPLDLHNAADLYRDRRGRHPPPGFDAWYAYAKAHDAIIVESFFDRIEADIAPFWGVKPKELADRAISWHSTVSVRNGRVTATGKLGKRNTPFLKIWKDLVAEAGRHLPNVNMPINNLDEPRVMMSWDDVNKLMESERASRKVLPVEDVEQKYTTEIPELDTKARYVEPQWRESGAWDMVRQACRKGTGGRDVAQPVDLSGPPQSSPGAVGAMSNGYVKNTTAAKDLCEMAHLSGAHAQLIRPSTMMMTTDKLPIFSGCKMLVNNDILLPGAAYLGEFTSILPWSTPHYSAKSATSVPWNKKMQGIFWRGITTGGLSSAHDWHRFHRFRLVEMLNGTHVSRVEQGVEQAKSFELPAHDEQGQPGRTATYPELAHDLGGKLGPWLESTSDAGFTRFFCANGNSLDDCSFLQPFFELKGEVKMSKQFRYKFLPDVDGNSYSGRYRSFLLSTSLPIKSTLFAEWHDDRLLPWLHFVPSSVDNQDLYAILHYFTRDERGDQVAQFIAEQGAAWASRVLRREDMLLYVWRVLLEFARVCDENRERLGFVKDLQ